LPVNKIAFLGTILIIISLILGGCSFIDSFVPFKPEFPEPEKYNWLKIAEGLRNPTVLTHAGDGSGRLFVVQKSGLINIIADGQILEEPFLDIRENIHIRFFEQGLLGIAFHPNYAENGYFFVHYTDTQGNTKLVRYTVSSSDSNLADPKSRKVILYVEQPWVNHNGGHIEFGPDGYLYIGLGFGRHDPDPEGNAQNLDILLGKLLRIDVDSGNPYAIPDDNPFANGGGRPEIWAYGLRNPYRFSFDPKTGDLFIGDVGGEQREEIDFLSADFEGIPNFGWNYNEGNLSLAGRPATTHYKSTVERPPTGTILQAPITDYKHEETRCAVIGGVVYHGAALPAWEGVYVYGDYCSGEIFALVPRDDGGWESRVLYESPIQVTSFGLDEDGELYVLDFGGEIYRLVALEANEEAE